MILAELLEKQYKHELKLGRENKTMCSETYYKIPKEMKLDVY